MINEMKKKFDLFIFDGDLLIDKIIPVKNGNSCNYEVVPKTKDFVITFYDKLEEYRKIRGLDDIVISVITSKYAQSLRTYEYLLYNLNDNPNIKLTNGFSHANRKDEFTEKAKMLPAIENHEYTIKDCFDKELSMHDYCLRLLTRDMKNVISLSFSHIETCDLVTNILSRANGIRNDYNFAKANYYELGLRDVHTLQDGVYFNRGIVIEELNELINHFKQGNEDFTNIKRKNYNVDRWPHPNTIYFEGNQSITKTKDEPKQLKKKL